MMAQTHPSLSERTLGWLILIFLCWSIMFSGWKISIILDKYNRGVYNDVLPKTLIKKVENDLQSNSVLSGSSGNRNRII